MGCVSQMEVTGNGGWTELGSSLFRPTFFLKPHLPLPHAPPVSSSLPSPLNSLSKPTSNPPPEPVSSAFPLQQSCRLRAWSESDSSNCPGRCRETSPDPTQWP